MIQRNRLTIMVWDLLFDALMRSGLIEVLNVGMKDTVQLLLVKDEQVIETLATHTAQKAFTDGIGPWCMVGRLQDLAAAGCGHARKTRSKFAITIANEILRRLSIRGCLSQLLCGPGIGRRASDPHMDDSARVQKGVEEGKQRTEKESGDRQEVTRPDLLGMGVQERLPGLCMWSCGAHSSHVLLNSALADVDAQLEQFTTNPLCSPPAIVLSHLLD